MGWDQKKCKEHELIVLVHDIGKIGVPAEILTKPGRLTPVEYELVKEHVDRGYKILKDVKFPLPIAEIIYQHHERLDGSGYPRGLKGDEILLEAKILMVADVVESMASHRPYRPSLGIETALKEITENRDIKFETSVVDTFLLMVSQYGYKLPV
jgi:HD-GYP domain-containing protein (c-di-GMP phosphodiesterase class II)